MSQLTWAILGTGNIARQFAAGVRSARRASIVAIGSRSADTARAFAAEHAAGAACGTYEDALKEPAVRAVYVSLPNSMHHQWTIKALRAGKHVLCEKPLAASAAEAHEMFAEARRAGRLLVEAFMYRAHPMLAAAVEVARSGRIGPIRLIRTSFCYRTTRIADNIRFDAALAGGALMDIGCYCIDFSCLVAGQPPAQVHAAGHIHERGVDDVVAGTLTFANGIVAGFTCGMSVQADNSACICGEDGYIEIPVPWKPPRQATFIIARGTPPKMDGARPAGTPPKLDGARPPGTPPRELRTVDAGADLYGIEADAFAAAVLDGAAPFISQRESLANMQVLDKMRAQLTTVHRQPTTSP